MPGALIASPSDNLATTATPTWAVGSANALYPVANVITLESDQVAKANETTATLRLTFGGSETLVGLGVINTNLGGLPVTLTNNGGMAAQVVTVPDPADGLAQSVWFDLRGVTGASGSQWNIAVAGAPSGVAIGTAIAVGAWLAPRLRWEYEMRERFPVISHRSSLGKRFVYRVPVRYRFFEAIAHWAEDRDLLRELRRDAQGSVIPFLLIPDEDDADALLVQWLEEDMRERYPFHDGSFSGETVTGVVDQPIQFEETSSGVAL
jgi:hypothetical protein